MHRFLSVLSLACLCLAACSDDEPVDVAGDYTIALTSRANGCNFDNWTEGGTNMGIALTMAQDGSQAIATVGGAAAVLLDFLQGDHVFTGEITGAQLDLQLFGSNEVDRDGCPHFVNSTIDARLNGDVLIGSLTYTMAGNGSPACEPFDGCASVQEFNGTRPPQ